MKINNLSALATSPLPRHPLEGPVRKLACYKDRLISFHTPGISLPPRHPGEGRDPEAIGTDWITASAGMTMREGCLRVDSLSVSCLKEAHQ